MTGSMNGPRLTEEEVFAELQLPQPGLHAVRDALAAGDRETARKQLAKYLRSRPSIPAWAMPNALGGVVNCESADACAEGRVLLHGVPCEFPGNEFDWFRNPTLNRKDMGPNLEWQWQLNRMLFWKPLAEEYRRTGNEKYAAAFVKQLRSWVRTCARPDDDGVRDGSAWRTIEAGIRMAHSWFTAYDAFVKSPSFADEDIFLFLSACIEHGMHLRRHQRHNNWVMMEMAGLFAVGAVFPELKSAAEWRAFAVERMRMEVQRQFLPDGAQFELTSSYHWVALENALLLVRIARKLGYAHELPGGLVAMFEKPFEYMVMIMEPGRRVPRLSDAWPVYVPGVLQCALELFPDRPDFRWAASNGAEGTPPPLTSVALPYAGYCVMRTGWEEDANYLCFDAGPLGKGHAHEDKLNLVLCSHGRELLFDAGGAGPFDSAFRDCYRDTFGHNTALVDGLPQRRLLPTETWEPIDARWQSTPGYDFAAQVYSEGYGGKDNIIASHWRRVLLVKPDIFIVADTLSSLDDKPHRFQVRWHIHSALAEQDQTTGCIGTADPGMPNLVFVPAVTSGARLRVVSARTEPEILGWYTGAYDAGWERATTILQDIRTREPRTIITVLLPLAAGGRSPVAGLDVAGDGSAVLRLRSGASWLISADPDPAGPLCFKEVLNGRTAREIRAC